MSGLSDLLTYPLTSMFQSLFRTDENIMFFWLIALVALLIIEIITLGLTTIWFAAGAFISFVAAWLGAPLGVQLAVFFYCLFRVAYFYQTGCSEASEQFAGEDECQQYDREGRQSDRGYRQL